MIARANRHRMPLDAELLESIVANCEKKRFAFSEDGLRIRANQGHSVEVDLKLRPIEPPMVLYHGTAQHSLDSIRQTGLNSGSRQQVHLSADTPTAIKVGQRHGKPVVLIVQAQAMQAAGHAFYRADNGVWLVDAVPVEFLTFSQ